MNSRLIGVNFYVLGLYLTEVPTNYNIINNSIVAALK
jgi:hypothetical protein